MGLRGGDLASPCPATTPSWEAVAPVATAHAGEDHQPDTRPVERVLLQRFPGRVRPSRSLQVSGGRLLLVLHV